MVLHKDAFTDFYFRGDNYIMKKGRLVYLAPDMYTGPLLHPSQILLNYLNHYGSNGLHNISDSEWGGGGGLGGRGR